MQFVERHAPEIAEQMRRVWRGKQQGELLGRRQQHVGRIAPLSLPLLRGGVAGAGFDPHRQFHLGNRDFEIAMNVDGERLQRRDVERVQSAPGPVGAPALGNVDQRGQETRQRLAGAGRRDQESVSPGLRRAHERALVRAHEPAARRKPAFEPGRKRIGGHA